MREAEIKKAVNANIEFMRLDEKEKRSLKAAFLVIIRCLMKLKDR